MCNGFVPTRRCSVLGSRVVAAPRLARLINKRLLGKYYVTSRGIFWASGAQAAVAARWSAAFGHSNPGNGADFTIYVEPDYEFLISTNHPKT